MTSGLSIRVAGGILALLLSALPACGLAASADQPAFTLDRLMSLLAQRRQGEVSFTETDYLTLLDRPMKSSGVLVYRAPDHLEKKTLRPKPESLVLQGDQLTVQRGHRTYRMQVSAYPQVAPYVDAMRDTLAGNEQALEKVFRVGLTGTLTDWKLELVPRDADVARKVKHVEIDGARDVIRTVEILQADGDRSVMTLGAPSPGSGAGSGQ
ncbi:MAG TPA: outer membrane lipoprotein carrier protein LolA [Steroidobacteraceae bacterium]|nr:outer membrane lipoprotein carrier protein LolA [Steroidobacteraceae bacterium]